MSPCPSAVLPDATIWFAASPTPHWAYGELIIDFTSEDALIENIDSIQQVLTERYPDAYVKLKRYNLMFKKYPIEAQFTGPDPAVLHQLADSAAPSWNRVRKSA